MATDNSVSQSFGKNLAELLAGKIVLVYPDFNSVSFITTITELVEGKSYTQRLLIFAEQLKNHLPANYSEALPILISILGDENPNETGMFKIYYWILPVAKFISLYGLEHYDLSIKGIEEVTKRNTGEYDIRPFIVKYPERTLAVMEAWANSPNFHLRRLASEGLRPKLPWATKLDIFIDNPAPVFKILEILKCDDILFVKKSVANHLTDWIKVNRERTLPLIEAWKNSDNPNTKWIIKRATRKYN